MIKDEQIRRIEKLAQLRLTSEERENMKEELGQILDYFEKLEELDTQDVDPLMHILDVENVLREDELEEPISQERALENAPQAARGFFEVPKVVDKNSKEGK
ncbi:MAG: Asp-tRNA(Asn)/Glu-tRNA(Gln) amidotransferase subunit GatC [Candidatus Bipolaricaulota bacterium]